MALGDFLVSAYDQINPFDKGRTFSTRGKVEEELRQRQATQLRFSGQQLKKRLDKGSITKEQYGRGLQTALDNRRRSVEASNQADYNSNILAKAGSFLSGYNVDGSKRNDPFSGFNRAVTRPIVAGFADSNIISTAGDLTQLISGGRYGENLSNLRASGTQNSFNQATDNIFQKATRATPGLAQDITLALATGGASAASKGAYKGLSLTQKIKKSSQLLRSGSGIVGFKHGVTEAADQFRGSLDAGNGLGEAYATGIGAGVVQGAITKYGMQNLLNPVGRNAATRLASRVLTEGVEEGSQQIASNLFRKIYDENTGILDGATEAALIGAMLGGGVSSVDVAKELVAKGVPPVYAYTAAKDIEQKAEAAIEDSNKLDKVVRSLQRDVQLKEPETNLSKIGQIKKSLVDSLSPIEDLVANLEKETGTTVTDKLDITDALDRSLRSGLIHKQFLQDTGFTDVLKEVPDVDLFNQYLIAKRAQEVERRYDGPVYYHGSPNDFTDIKTGSELGTQQQRSEIYITTDENLASSYKNSRDTSVMSDELRSNIERQSEVLNELDDETDPASIDRLEDEYEKLISKSEKLRALEKNKGVLKRYKLRGKSADVTSDEGASEIIEVLRKNKDDDSLGVVEKRYINNVLSEVDNGVDKNRPGNKAQALRFKLFQSALLERSPNIKNILKDAGYSAITYDHQAINPGDKPSVQTIVFDGDSLVDLDRESLQPRKTGRDAELDQRIIETYGPEYEQYAQRAYDFTKAMREYMVESGIYSRELIDQLERDNPLYVPLERRVGPTKGGFLGGNQVASLGKPDTIKKLKGSDKDIVDPLQTLLVNSGKMIQQGERNKAAQVLTDIAAIPGFESLARPLEPGENASGRPTISVYRDGVKQIYEVAPEIESAAKSLDVQQLNAVQRLMTVGTRLLRAGATGFNAPFAATNLTKDQQTAFIFSKEGIRSANPVEFVRALKAVVTQDSLYQDAQRSAATGTLFQSTRNNAPKDIQTIRSGRGIIPKTIHTIRNPKQLLDVIENVIGATEQATRVKQFNVQRKALLKQGVPLDQATREAAKGARRDTVDFFRKGDMGPTLNSTHAYLNAGIQGSRQLVKSFQNRPVATTAKVIMSMYLPYMAAMAWNYGDEERKEVYDDISEFEKDGNIIIVKGGGKNDRGQYDVIKIPLAPGISSLLAPLKDFIENDPDGGRTFSASSIGKAITGAATPIPTGNPTQLAGMIIPDIARPTVEGIVNTNFFTGEPIVPDYLENLPEEEQVKKGTSGTAKQIGKLLGTSPLYIDSWIKGTGAGVGNQFINAADNALAKAGVIEDSDIRGESALTNLTRRYTKAYGGVQDELRRTEREDIINSLSPADRAAYNSLHTYNYKDGEIVFQEKPLFSQEKAATYINNPQVFEVDRALAFKDNAERGKPLDPLFAVPDEISNFVLLSKVALPGESADLKKQILYEQPWYDEFRAMQDKYYDEKARWNAEQGYNQEPREDDGYPQASPELQVKLDTFNNLTEGKSDYIRNNPELSAYFDATRRFKNVQRAKLGLPPLEDYTNGNGFYSGGGGSRSGGSSRSRGGGGGSTIRPSQYGRAIARASNAPSVPTRRKATVRKRKQKASRNRNSLKLTVNRAKV